MRCIVEYNRHRDGYVLNPCLRAMSATGAEYIVNCIQVPEQSPEGDSHVQRLWAWGHSLIITFSESCLTDKMWTTCVPSPSSSFFYTFMWEFISVQCNLYRALLNRGPEKGAISSIYVMLCYVMLCYVMLCYVMLCYVMLCYVMLC